MHNNNLNIKNTYIWLSIIQRRLELVIAQGDFDVIIEFALQAELAGTKPRYIVPYNF